MTRRNKLDSAQAKMVDNEEPYDVLAELHASHEVRIQAEYEKLRGLCNNVQVLLTDFDPSRDSELDLTIELNDLFAKANIHLSEQKVKIIRAIKFMDAFRLRHGLSHEPDDQQIALNLISLALMIFVEGGINSSFFLNAHMVSGPFAAVLTSVLISFANVFVSALVGFFAGRYKHYGDKAADHDADEFVSIRNKAKRRFWGYVATMGGFHITVGLVRATEELERVHHSLESYLSLLTTPEAIFLVMTGAGFSVLAYHKGKHLDEPYPKYGKFQRRITDLRDEMTDLYEVFVEEINERYDEAFSDLEKQAKASKKESDAINKAIQSCVDAKGKLETAIVNAQSDMRRHIAQLTSVFTPRRGRKSKATEDALNSLTRFDGLLDIDLPDYMRGASSQDQKAMLAKSRSKALERLSVLYKSALKSDNGDHYGEYNEIET